MDQSVGAGADRVLYVLATLARHDGPLSIAALAEKTGLAQSTLYRQVALLKRWGFVGEHEGEYGPGPLCVQLAWGFDQSSFLIHEAQPDMAALAAASGETIGLLVAVKDQAVCLDMVESQHPLRCSFTKGAACRWRVALRPSRCWPSCRRHACRRPWRCWPGSPAWTRSAWPTNCRPSAPRAMP